MRVSLEEMDEGGGVNDEGQLGIYDIRQGISNVIGKKDPRINEEPTLFLNRKNLSKLNLFPVMFVLVFQLFDD